MISAETKLERLQAAEQILLSRPADVNRAELAQKLDINPATAPRYVDEFARTPPIHEENGGRLVIDLDLHLNNFRLSLDEVMALYLVVTLRSTTIDRRNIHAASALRKLGHALSAPASLIGTQLVTRSWAGTHKVRISYFSRRHDDATEYVFFPYVVLPYAVGRTLHTIGAGECETRLCTFRLDRIRGSPDSGRPLRHSRRI